MSDTTVQPEEATQQESDEFYAEILREKAYRYSREAYFWAAFATVIAGLTVFNYVGLAHQAPDSTLDTVIAVGSMILTPVAAAITSCWAVSSRLKSQDARMQHREAIALGRITKPAEESDAPTSDTQDTH